MDVAVQLAAIAKKALEILASNEKGRRFLGYAVGIAIFIILLPLIALVGLFGWMSGESDKKGVAVRLCRKSWGCSAENSR